MGRAQALVLARGDARRGSMKYEISIHILDKHYIDSLIVALARQGYAPYYNEDEGCVCFTGTEEEVREIKGVRDE